ncbi:MAG: 5-formyltetrahydrofolate cyclo-ligase [Coriobacteriales bacterium]|jgi:5-formyltetrahydrofolate cyclo-ligase|nr:5-formyltetrahydrofolate cyclo-ligase [Coriobacteriales bacterium]
MEKTGHKEPLRRALLARREQLSAQEHRVLSERIVERLMRDEDVLHAQVILSYQAFRGEVDLAAFNAWAQAEGKELAFPLCRDVGIMDAAVPEDADALLTGRFGIVAPDPARSRIIAPDTLDLAIVPCVGFDEHSTRLGMGGGFYDRYLPQCTNAHKLGVAFSFQRVTTPFADPWDTALDRVITE